MEKEDAVLQSLRYIESNITQNLNANMIADFSGYSLYHFSRMFRERMGISVMEYVKRRRLVYASRCILGGMKIIDAALECGYQSHSGFTKAFKQQFGFSPVFLHLFEQKSNTTGGTDSMKHVFYHQLAAHALPEELYQILLKTMDENRIEYEKDLIKQCYELAAYAHKGQYRHSMDAYLTHGMNVAILLAQMEAQSDLIMAGMLHDVRKENTKVQISTVKELFGTKVAALVEGMEKTEPETEEIGLWDEVTLLKLADRLHNMRTVEAMDEKQWGQKAEETIRLYVPLAAHLGYDKLQTELMELSVKYLT